ncbi:MAG: hypothetical protein ACYS6K_14690 [Planctomycetota bacterium]|jgi:hypothetical protein
MKKTKTNNLRCWAIGILAILLLAAPSGRAVVVECKGEAHIVDGVDINCGEGKTHLINEDIDALNVWRDTTVNLEANVSQYVYVDPGGTLNVYSGNVGMFIVLFGDTDELQDQTVTADTTVTVYGINFAVDGVPTEENQFIPDLYLGSFLTGTYENNATFNLWFISDNIPIYLEPPESDDPEITIDIKPGSDENVINLKSRGVVPVAVITTVDFNAGFINPDSVEFAGASPVRSTLCDVDCDGDKDMLFLFKTQNLVDLDETSTEATLTAMLKGATLMSRATAGDVLEGTDKVKIMSSKKQHYSKRYTYKHKRQGPKKHKDR